MSNKEETAVCRGCGMNLKGKPYRMGGSAYHPKTNEQCPVNFYGGFVCSYRCDEKASLQHERSMPGHGYSQTELSGVSLIALRSNWNED